MTDSPKRHVWQIHLRTGITLMFAAGILIWLSMPRSEEFSGRVFCGWPFDVFVPGPGMPSYHRINLITGMVKNVLLDISVLLGVLNLSEYVIRRQSTSTARRDVKTEK